MRASWNHVCVAGFGTAKPDEVWTSDAIEARLGPLYHRLNLPQGRLELMTGIKERRHWSLPVKPSQAGTEAALDLIEKLGLDPLSIDCVVHAAVCRDRLEPATAAYVHGALGLRPDAPFFDLSNACLGVVQSMALAASWIETGLMRSVLIVAGENGQALLEDTIRELLGGVHDRQSIKPYFANLTIGSGAVAVLLTHASLAPKRALTLKAAVSYSDTDARFLCQGGDSLQM
ncbi:MAG TPA: 3-oxoacyl-ACP synthase III, partial [Opitutales bacterium]|nr:3-oxoacyl-ACP synthase III [Opitutales bacterium]